MTRTFKNPLLGERGTRPDDKQPPTKRSRTNAPRIRTRASPRSGLTWCDLPPELLGTISTFLDIGTELQNLLVVVGREHADLIKKAFLWRNSSFLRRTLTLAGMLKRQYNFRQWLAVNKDWRSMCKNMLLSGEQYEVTVPTKSGAIMIEIGELKKELRMMAFLGYRRFPDGSKAPCEEANLIRNLADFVVAVNGQSIVDKPFCEVVEMVKGSAKEKSVKLRFLDGTFIHCLCNPGIAIDLGLVEVLQCLVEEKGVDINKPVWQSRAHKRAPLLVPALSHPDASMLHYLLSVDGIDCNCNLPGFGRGGIKPLHYAAGSGAVEASRLKTLIEHEGIDILARDEMGRNALYYAAGYALDANTVAKINILLEAGVDPNVRSFRGHTALDYARCLREDGQSMAQDEVLDLLESAMIDA